MKKLLAMWLCVAASGLMSGLASGQVSDRPDTPFKLASFSAGGQTRLGVLLGDMANSNRNRGELIFSPQKPLQGRSL